MIRHTVSIVILTIILTIILANQYVVKKYNIATMTDHRTQIEKAQLIQSDVAEIKDDIMVIRSHLSSK